MPHGTLTPGRPDAFVHTVRDDGKTKLGQEEKHNAEDDDHPEKQAEIGRNEIHGTLLNDNGQQGDDDGEQGGALHHTGGDDHGRTQVAGAFRLTGDGLHGGFANLTDTDGCGDCSDGGAKCGTCFTEGHTRGCLKKNC